MIRPRASSLRKESHDLVAQASAPASSGAVSVQDIQSTGKLPKNSTSETLPELAAGTAALRASRRMLPALAVACVVALAAAIAHAQLSKYARTKNFIHTEHYDRPIAPGNPTNALKIRIRGAEGQFLDNEQVRITTARIEHYPMNGKGTNLVANTPVCLFDPGMHTLTSTDRVDIVARDGAIVVNGSAGFRLDTTNATLHVSNRVRTTIQGSLFQSGRIPHP